MDTITTTQPPFNLKNLNLPPPQPPPSISELRHISAALSQFLRDYDDLQSHIGSVNAALDEKLSLRYKGDVDGTESDEGVKNCEKSDCDGVVNDVLEGVVVTDGKCQGSVSESECEWSDEHESSNYVKKREESDCEHAVSDDCERGVRVYQTVKKDEEIIDALVKMEESDCAEIIIDVSEAVVLEQNLNGSEIIVTDFGDARVSGQSSNSAASECEQGDDESPHSPNSCKETDNESEETDDEGEKLGAAKNVEETDYDRAMNELLEDIDAIEKNPIRTASKCDNVRKPQSSSSLENSEETDDEDGEIEAPERPEDADYDRIVTELLEDIDVVPKPNRTASDSDQSYDKHQSPNSLKTHLDEIDVSMNPEDKNHEQTDVSMENSEETDDEDGKIEAPERPEDADYDRIVTKLLEDIDVVPKPNRTASDSDQSYDKHQSPNSLKTHLDEIDVSINPEDKNHEQTDVSMETNVSEKHEEMDILKNPAESDVSEKLEEIDIAKNPEETDVFKKPEKADVSEKPEEADVSEKPEYVEILTNPKPAVSELEMLCESMSGREMKKYVVKHIFDIDKLRTELLKALKLAINPAKLVLDSIGTYFLESSTTYHWGSFQYLNNQINGRQASLLILECFVMISGDGIKISREDEAYAAEDAYRWKTRMMNEGGLESTEEADARGLLLFISGFGISDRFFSTVDIMDLMRASNVKRISNILRRSIVLMPKIPEVIDMMVMSKLEVQAADIAYTFGLEYKCHPLTILAKFVRNIIGDIKNGSPVQVIEAMNQKLDDLISVKECLESHNIDPSKVLSEFKIDEEIHHLKKGLKLQVQKRKAMGIESLPNPNHQEAKRTCFSHQTMPHGISLFNQSMQPGYSYRDSNYFPLSLLNAPALPVDITNSVTSGLAGPNGNIRPYGWQDEALVKKYLVRPYPSSSQTYDSQPSLTGLYGRRPGFPVCMPGHLGYPGYFPSGGFPARRGPASDLYAFADVVEKETRGSRAVGSGTGRSSYY